MSNTVIHVENLSKKYIIDHLNEGQSYTTLRDVVTRYLKGVNIFKGAQPPMNTQSPKEAFWALKDVSFEIKQGDRVGIIGRNGAGKSTLLKILSRITEPTHGRIRVKGRIASLLEVGTGFHPELTGRENVFLNGSVLGMSKAEIQSKFDEIVDFSGVEKFLDTPVKRYSSGMYVRLAFAVAAHLEPEILIVDEVLAVGDIQFQKKCLGKMEQVANEGRTVLFVSHNTSAIRKLCNHGILLENGGVKTQGDISTVLQTYLEGRKDVQSIYELPSPQEKSGACYGYKLAIEDKLGNLVSSIPVGQPWQVRVNFVVNHNVEHFIIALGLVTSDDISLKTSWSKPYFLQPGEYQVVFREESIILAPGRYTLNIGLSEKLQSIHYIENAGVLEIAEYSEGIDLVKLTGVGTILNPMDIEIEDLNGQHIRPILSKL
jgi:lipopolysaccharide transport system ATP-binding protein